MTILDVSTDDARKMMHARSRSRPSLSVMFLAGAMLATAFSINGTPQDATADQAGVTVTPEHLDFGEAATGTATAPQRLTVTNSTQEGMPLGGIILSGIDFSQTTTCGASLDAGASCSIEVTFKPATTGPRLGTVSVDTRRGRTRIVPLNGTGK